MGLPRLPSDEKILYLGKDENFAAKKHDENFGESSIMRERERQTGRQRDRQRRSVGRVGNAEKG